MMRSRHGGAEASRLVWRAFCCRRTTDPVAERGTRYAFRWSGRSDHLGKRQTAPDATRLRLTPPPHGKPRTSSDAFLIGRYRTERLKRSASAKISRSKATITGRTRLSVTIRLGQGWRGGALEGIFHRCCDATWLAFGVTFEPGSRPLPNAALSMNAERSWQFPSPTAI